MYSRRRSGVRSGAGRTGGGFEHPFLNEVIDMAVILNRKPSMHPKIISPRTGRPLVEDLLGEDNLRRLMGMLSKDERLSPEMKHAVILRVVARRSEIDDGSKTLADIAAFEADRLIKERAN